MIPFWNPYSMGYYLKLIGVMGNIMMMVRKPKKILLLYYRTGSPAAKHTYVQTRPRALIFGMVTPIDTRN